MGIKSSPFTSKTFTFHKNYEPLGGTYGFKKISKFAWILDERKFFTTSELRRLKRVVDERKREAIHKNNKTAIRDWFVINLAVYTGLRVMEMANLVIDDLIILNGNSSLFVRQGKNGKPRSVKLPIEFKKILFEYLEWKKSVNEPFDAEAPLIYSTNSKKAMTTRGIQKIFERNAKRANIKGHSIHHLRHTYASHLYKASKYNLRLVQKQLGHSSIKVTEVYADVFAPDLVKAVSHLYGN